jgi:hypothetical protein
MPSAIYAAAVAAFDQADWQHGEPNDHDTLGTSIIIENRFIGGSLRVYNDTIVRFLAFGHGEVEAAHRARVTELFARLNPLLLNGSLEIDDIIGAVCRTSVNVEGLVDPVAETLYDEMTARSLVLDLALAATGVYSKILPAIEAVEAGGDIDEIVESVGLTAPASIPARS